MTEKVEREILIKEIECYMAGWRVNMLWRRVR